MFSYSEKLITLSILAITRIHFYSSLQGEINQHKCLWLISSYLPVTYYNPKKKFFCVIILWIIYFIFTELILINTYNPKIILTINHLFNHHSLARYPHNVRVVSFYFPVSVYNVSILYGVSHFIEWIKSKRRMSKCQKIALGQWFNGFEYWFRAVNDYGWSVSKRSNSCLSICMDLGVHFFWYTPICLWLVVIRRKSFPKRLT